MIHDIFYNNNNLFVYCFICYSYIYVLSYSCIYSFLFMNFLFITLCIDSLKFFILCFCVFTHIFMHYFFLFFLFFTETLFCMFKDTRAFRSIIPR